MTETKRSRPTGNGAAPKSTATDSDQSNGTGLDAWRRRHALARRLAPLDCGCRDPWPCRCTVPPLSDDWIDAGRDAAIRLLNMGMVPLLEIEVLQALWRRGGTERELATVLFEATGGQIA